MPTTRILLPLVAALLWLPARSQSVADMQQKYPGEQEVVLEHSAHYTITLKDGQPQVQSEETQRFLYLSAESGAYLSKYGFSHSGFHQLEQYSAYTITANAKKIKVTDFKTTDSKVNGIFYDDVKETSFDFPAVAPGSIGTLETSMLDKDPHLLSPFFFSWMVPVIHAELKISFPRNMHIQTVIKGSDSAHIRFTQETRHGETTYIFSADSLDAERAYEDAPGSRWYSRHVIFYIATFVNDEGKTVNYLSSPADLYHMYTAYLRDINKEAGADLRHLVDSLCLNAPDLEDKARKIYGWVQQNVKYIAFEQGMEGFIPRTPIWSAAGDLGIVKT